MLPDLLHTANKEHQLGIKKVTSISTLCQVFNSCNYGKTMLNEVHQLLRIYITVSMTTATAERTFSIFRQLKNYLQSTMTQKRLNHIVLLHTHKHRTDELELILKWQVTSVVQTAAAEPSLVAFKSEN